MPGPKQALEDLHTRLGYKRLNRPWAKVEILLGLSAAGAGVFLGDWSLKRSEADLQWILIVAGLAWFVLGGYLAMAGQRSHLYQSSNERTAYLAELIRSMNDKGKRE